MRGKPVRIVSLPQVPLDGARRGRGLGRPLATTLFPLLAQARFRHLHLGAAPGEEGALAFWRSLGLWESEGPDGVTLFEHPLRDG